MTLHTINLWLGEVRDNNYGDTEGLIILPFVVGVALATIPIYIHHILHII